MDIDIDSELGRIIRDWDECALLLDIQVLRDRIRAAGLELRPKQEPENFGGLEWLIEQMQTWLTLQSTNTVGRRAVVSCLRVFGAEPRATMPCDHAVPEELHPRDKHDSPETVDNEDAALDAQINGISRARELTESHDRYKEALEKIISNRFSSRESSCDIAHAALHPNREELPGSQLLSFAEAMAHAARGEFIECVDEGRKRCYHIVGGDLWMYGRRGNEVFDYRIATVPTNGCWRVVQSPEWARDKT